MPSFVFSEEPAKPVKVRDGAATVDVKVTNTAGEEKVGTVLVEPEAPATFDWLTIAGEATRSYAPGATEDVAIAIAVPAGTAPATYAFQLDAKAEDNPDEDYTNGPRVQFEVPKPRPPLPWWRRYWWVFAIAAAIVLAAILVVMLS
jgi:hypothetical protein